MNIVIIEGLSDRSTHDLIIESHHRLPLYAPHQRPKSISIDRPFHEEKKKNPVTVCPP